MSVPEDKGIYRSGFEFLKGILHQPFAFGTQKMVVRTACMRATQPAGTIGQPYSKIGVQPLETPLKKSVFEDAL